MRNRRDRDKVMKALLCSLQQLQTQHEELSLSVECGRMRQQVGQMGVAGGDVGKAGWWACQTHCNYRLHSTTELHSDRLVLQHCGHR